MKKIKEILKNPSFDRLEALVLQHNMLLEKKRRLEQVIETIEKTIQHARREDHVHSGKICGFRLQPQPV